MVQAIQSCSTEQRDLLEKHYGRDNADDVAVVKVMSQLREFFMNIRSWSGAQKLFLELDLQKKFREYEEKSYGILKEKISKVENLPQEVSDTLFNSHAQKSEFSNLYWKH